MQEQNEPLICPWCLTEIVWDEEIGPEQHCPHCENELSNYRTIELGVDEEEEDSEEALAEVEEDDVMSDDDYHKRWLAEQEDGYQSLERSKFAVDSIVQSIVDDQDEVPECPSCREYMVEIGTQTVEPKHFKPRTAPSLGKTIVEAPFELTVYLCPACFQTSTYLPTEHRKKALKRLMPED